VPVLLGVNACASAGSELQQHQRKLQSLATGARLIGADWLSGALSSRFTVTALERTYELVEEERPSLAANPQAVAHGPAGELADLASREAQTVARLAGDVRQQDRASVERHLADISPDRMRPGADAYAPR